MNETISLLVGVTYLCLFVFFTITCVNSIRGFRHLKAYSKTTQEFHRRSDANYQILWTDYTRAIKDLTDTVSHLEKKIDELRIQIGVINGRMGDYSRVINIPSSAALTDVSERKKPGPKPGSKRIPKSLPVSQ